MRGQDRELSRVRRFGPSTLAIGLALATGACVTKGPATQGETQTGTDGGDGDDGDGDGGGTDGVRETGTQGGTATAGTAGDGTFPPDTDLRTWLELDGECGDLRKVAYRESEPNLVLMVDLPPQNGGDWQPDGEGGVEVVRRTYPLPHQEAKVRLFVNPSPAITACPEDDALPEDAETVYEALAGSLQTEWWSEDKDCIFSCERLFIEAHDLELVDANGERLDVPVFYLPQWTDPEPP